MDKQTLKEAGLQDGEINIYISLLRLKEATATEIAQDTGVHRSHIYDLIEKLREKGLVSHVIRNNTKCFLPARPRRILEYLKEKENKISKLIPELERLSQNKKEDVKVEIFKGKEGIKTVLNDILNEKKDYLLFGELKFEELLPFFIDKFVKIANEEKIKEKAILKKGTKIIPTKRKEYRYISEEYLLPNAIVVYGNKVASFIWKEPFYAILTENKDIASSYKNHFNLLWKLAKK